MAVYTEVSDEELSSFIASYGLGELLSFKAVSYTHLTLPTNREV